MKLEDLTLMPKVDIEDEIPSMKAHNLLHRCQALEDRLAYAKELLIESGTSAVEYMDYHSRKNAFIEKLNAEGL